MNVLIIGECGVGKTWVLKQLLKNTKAKKLGMFYFHENSEFIITGKYDGSVFEGSDKLSMGVMKDLKKMLLYIKQKNKTGVFEGDRFMNQNFIKLATPIILKIKGNGVGGRLKRGSNQSERQLKTIKTRVKNIISNYDFENSNECYKFFKNENNKITTS